MAAEIGALCSDLWEEQRSLVSRVEGLGGEQWRLPTPADGWTVGDSISHLCFFTELALLAVEHPARFVAERTVVADELPRPDLALATFGPALCGRWNELTARLVDAVQAPGRAPRIPWYGPEMSRASFVTARIMETWAHGQDVADALGLPSVVSARLRHVCHLGVATRSYSYAINERRLPPRPVAVRLSAPNGEEWTWHEQAESRGRIVGTALDFALVVTQRRHLADTALEVVDDEAREWMELAQAFAGRPTRAARSPA